MSDLRRWELAGLVALAVIVLAIPLSTLRPGAAAPPSVLTAAPVFAGTAACAECHPAETEQWRGSDHDLAMAGATEDTVLGDFDDTEVTVDGVAWRFFRRDGRFLVLTDGPDGTPQEFEVRYTFGYDPLQQYLVPFPGGRLQALSVAWDTLRKRWYDLYPDNVIPRDDWLHWTRGGQNWNGMCAECHSTNLVKGFDAATDSYHTTWSDIDVGCEACHGPGSRHVAWARMPAMARPELAGLGLVVDTSDLSGPELVELCAPCHSRRAELGDYDHSGGELLNFQLPSLLREELYFADGQIHDEVYVYGSFLQSKMYARGVSCRDCHSSHSGRLHRDGNELCLQCHQREVYDTSDHHFHKRMVDGKPSDGALCVRCHMPERAYMVVDWRADHSFRVPRPDLTASIGTPNACMQAGCHADRPLQYALDATRRWYGQARKPHYGTAVAAAWRGAPGAADELVRIVDNTLQPTLVRATALELLAQYTDPRATAALRSALDSEHALLRYTAVARLNEPRPETRVELLAPLLADPVAAVRYGVASNLAGTPRELLRPYQREALERAIADYRRAMTYNLDFASSGMNLGNLEAALGDPAGAEHYYRVALAVDDLFFPAKMNLATLLAGQGRVTEAATLLAEVVAAYPDNPDAAYSLALALVELGRPGEALAPLRRAAAEMPTAARVHYNLGLLEQQQGNLDAAERELRRAVELQPGSFDLLYALADHLVRRGRYDDAAAVVERLSTEFQDRPGVREIAAFLERAGAADLPHPG